MSTLADRVEEEARRAEAENPDEPTPEPEPEPKPEPEPEPEPQAFVNIGPEEIRKAEAKRTAYRKAIGAILGEEAVTHECLLCAGLGYLPDLPPPGTQFGIILTDDGPALVADEPMREPEYLPAPDKAECPECAGLGMVLTGAKTEHGRVAPCSKCSGNGWVMVIRPEAPGPPAFGTPPPPVAPSYAEGNGLGPDAWGRPYGHQHWGVAPASIPG